MNIAVKIISHSEQRYDTCGDWWVDENEDLQIRVSNLANQRYESLVAVHEIVEALLCIERTIPEDEVSKFDIEFSGEGEPGDDPSAPYRKEHFFATSVERLLAAELGVDWLAYDTMVESL